MLIITQAVKNYSDFRNAAFLLAGFPLLARKINVAEIVAEGYGLLFTCL